MGFSRDVIGVVQGVDGVKVVSASGYGTAKFAGTVSDFSSVDPATADEVFDLGMVQGEMTDLTDTGVLVHDDAARKHGWQVGEVLPSSFPKTGATRLRVEGIYDDKSFIGTDYVISTSGHTRYDPDRLESSALVVVDDGADVSTVELRISDALATHPDATVMDQKEFEGALGGFIDQLLSLVTVRSCSRSSSPSSGSSTPSRCRCSNAPASSGCSGRWA